MLSRGRGVVLPPTPPPPPITLPLWDIIDDTKTKVGLLAVPVPVPGVAPRVVA